MNIPCKLVSRGSGAALLGAALLGSAPLWSAGAAHATVQVAIDLTHQRMHVEADEGTFDWPISSARSGFSTPHGSYAPERLELMHYSHKYHMSPMPHAIFFRGGYAIHGTYSTASLGRPASHGCVRLSPGNATTLYDMVRHEGARIAVSGTPPASRPFATASYRGADEGDPRPRRTRRSYGDGDGGGYGYGGGGYAGYGGYQPYVDPNGGGYYSYGLGY